MAKTYNTDELRRIASAIHQSSEDVSGVLRITTQWIREDIPEHLSGNAADAFAEVIDEIHEELVNLGNETDDIGLKLKSFAAALEQADRQAAEMISSK